MNIKELRLGRGISQQDLANATGIPRSRIAKWEEGKGNPKVVDMKKLENFFANELRKASESSTLVNEMEAPYGEKKEPIIQIVLNLSYIGMKNADSMDKMAATNQRNSEIIAALVGTLVPNSKLAEKLTASLADQHADDDFAIEDILNKEGIEILEKQLKHRKKATTNK